MMAGSDFVKTSTGKEAVNATFPVALVMVRAVRDYYQVLFTFLNFTTTVKGLYVSPLIVKILLLTKLVQLSWTGVSLRF